MHAPAAARKSNEIGGEIAATLEGNSMNKSGLIGKDGHRKNIERWKKSGLEHMRYIRMKEEM
jgi:hypothetical protein